MSRAEDAKTFARYRGHLGPWGPKLEKESENEFLGALGPGAQKVENGVENREQKRHIKLSHIKLFPVAPVTGPPGRVSRQKDLCCLGSEDST